MHARCWATPSAARSRCRSRSARRPCAASPLAPVGFGAIVVADWFSVPGLIDLWQLALPIALVNPLTVTAAYTTFVAHGRLPSLDLMAWRRKRAFRCGPGVRAAAIAIAAIRSRAQAA